MYSTPGISHSSFSIGLVTRCSTSCADAPGICTKTSIMGTMICGSSSRGSFQTAKAPISSDAAIISGVSLEPIQAWANRPAGPSGGIAHGRTSTRAPSRKPWRNRRDHSLHPRSSPESTSTWIRPACPVVTRRLCATPSSTTNTDLHLPSLHHGLRRDRHHLSRPSWNSARPNMPERSIRKRGQIDLHHVSARGSVHRGTSRKRASSRGPTLRAPLPRLAPPLPGQLDSSTAASNRYRLPVRW